MKFIFHFFVSLFATAFIGFLITQFMQSTLAFKVMKPVAETRANWSGQLDLFSQDATGRDVIVIGDKDFVKSVRDAIGGQFSIYYYSSYEGSINTIAEAYIYLEPNDFKYVVLQNRPFYWTNYWATPVSTFGNFSDMRLWTASKQDDFISKSSIRLFFQMLEIRAAKLLQEPEVKQPESMAYVSWSDWPSDNHFYFSSLRKKIRPDKTFWIRDISSLPADLPPDILPKFESRFGSKKDAPSEVPGIGISLDINDLAKAMNDL